MVLVVALGALLVAERPAQGALDDKVALASSQAAIGRQIPGYTFTDAQRRHVQLTSYRGKPLIISLVYTSCADICPTVSDSLAAAVETARTRLGNDSFHVVTIGFDSRHDTPERMLSFARAHGLTLDNWDFLSGDGDTIDRLAADLGFLFAPAPQGFDHMAQTTLLDADGRVHRQIYGATFDAPLLVEPLKELILGEVGGGTGLDAVIDRIRLICTVYDPSSGRYKFSYSIFISAILGAVTLATIAGILVRSWLRLRRLTPH
jgi:protein SCO1/2